MEILQYIAELVQSQREIGIIGLGTIYKKKSPGRYDAATQSFLPPSYTIAFKEEITDPDTLNTRFALAENISRDAANEAIATFVENIRKQLSTVGQANISPLGTLRLENGSILLDVQQDYNPGLEFFGLPRLQNEPLKPEAEEFNEPEPINQVEEVNSSAEFPDLEAIEPTATEALVTAPIAPEPVAAEPVAPLSPVVEPETISDPVGQEPQQSAAPEASTPPVAPEVKVDPVEEEIIIDNLLEEENPGNETHEPQLIEVQKPPVENSIKYTIHEQPPAKKSDSLMLKVVLALLALVVIGILAYLFYPRATEPAKKPVVVAVDSTKTRTDSIQKASAAKAVQDSIARQDSLSKQKADGTKVNLADTVNKPAVDTATTYEIIGASVLNQKEADWFITQMKRNGIKAKVVRNIPGKRLKMSIGTVGDEKTAKAERDRLEKKLGIKGIYIYRNKKE